MDGVCICPNSLSSGVIFVNALSFLENGAFKRHFLFLFTAPLALIAVIVNLFVFNQSYGT